VELGLRGKVALVTGGSRGIGKDIALSLAREGVDVAICARSAPQLEATSKEIGALGVRSVAIVADLFNAPDCQRVVDETVAALGRLDILVNNASTNVDQYPTDLELISDTQLMERVMGKALGTIRCSRAALTHIRAAGGGSIVCLGGTSARNMPLAGGYPQGLGNAMVANFAKRLSNHLAKDGISVNVVHPGSVKTDRYAARLQALATKLGVSLEEADAQRAAAVPIGRMIVPMDIAPLVVFLTSPLARAITGQGIAVDGGITPQVIY